MINKNGKMPLSKKGSVTANPDSIFANKLGIPKDVQEDLTANNLVGRWIDGKKLTESYGYHDKGWVPYQLPEKLRKSQWRTGNDPDGTLRRGSLVLAVKTTEDVAKHKAFLKLRAEQSTVQRHNKEEAEKMRHWAKEAGDGVKIIEGYEENE